MKVNRLYLCLTRNCTLECEHCLRGTKEEKNMSPETIERIMKDITSVHSLLLSGGEPLLNIQGIKYLTEVIQKYHIDIHTICISTNGTICTPVHIQALLQLQACCKDFILSF